METDEKVDKYIESLAIDKKFTARQIADKLGIKTQQFIWHLSKLKESGVINVVKIMSPPGKGQYAIYQRGEVNHAVNCEAEISDLYRKFNFGLLNA